MVAAGCNSGDTAAGGEPVETGQLATAQGYGDRVEIPAADPADVESIDAILTAVYDVISGPAGLRDWDRFRSLFIPEARLIQVGPNQDGVFDSYVRDPEGFIEGADPYFRENGFFEREIARSVDEFGHIAHAFSTYASFHNADDPEPFNRGINSFQLMNDGRRWWVVTIYWQHESPAFPIPDRYLP
jgi:hypothetical protein